MKLDWRWSWIFEVRLERKKIVKGRVNLPEFIIFINIIMPNKKTGGQLTVKKEATYISPNTQKIISEILIGPINNSFIYIKKENGNNKKISKIDLKGATEITEKWSNIRSKNETFLPKTSPFNTVKELISAYSQNAVI